MYHWSISDQNPYRWRFCIKAGDRIIADRLPILELHVQPDARDTTVFDGYEMRVGPHMGEIHIYHPSGDEYNAYLEEMFDQNDPELTMELWPNLTSDTINVFRNVRMRSSNYFPFQNLEVVETQWVFRGGEINQPMETVQVREDSILQQILDLDTDPTELVTMVGPWKPDEPIQKLDWRHFGF